MTISTYTKHYFLPRLLVLVYLWAYATTAPATHFLLPNGTLNTAAIGNQSLRLDPTLGPVFAPASVAADGFSALGRGLNGTVPAMSGRDVYVGGDFTGVGSGGTTVSGLNYIAKWAVSILPWHLA